MTPVPQRQRCMLMWSMLSRKGRKVSGNRFFDVTRWWKVGLLFAGLPWLHLSSVCSLCLRPRGSQLCLKNKQETICPAWDESRSGKKQSHQKSHNHQLFRLQTLVGLDGHSCSLFSQLYKSTIYQSDGGCYRNSQQPSVSSLLMYETAERLWKYWPAIAFCFVCHFSQNKPSESHCRI